MVKVVFEIVEELDFIIDVFKPYNTDIEQFDLVLDLLQDIFQFLRIIIS